MTAVLLALFAAAFTPAQPEAEPRFERQPALVESLELSVEESFPIEVTVTLAGVLPDMCTQIETLVQRFDPDRRSYRLELAARRERGVICAQSVTAYEVSVPLVKAGLATGTFLVETEGPSASFAIEPLGEFPGLDLPSAGPSIWVCALAPRVCFEAPSEWSGTGLEWSSPPYLAAVLGLRWWASGVDDPQALLPTEAEIHDRTMARLGGSLGTRMTLSRDDRSLWSEHLFARCGDGLWCEFWLEAPTEPLLDAAGEPFWRLVRFVTPF